MEEVGEHSDAALLDLRGLGVLGVVDEVAVEVLGDEPLSLRLHPGGHEGREVALWIAFQLELQVDHPHRVEGRHSGLGEVGRRGRFEEEPVPVTEGEGVLAVVRPRHGPIKSERPCARITRNG